MLAFFLLTGLTAGAEPTETPLPEQPAAEEKLPEDPVRLYNAALAKQRAGDSGSEAVYAEAIRRGAAAPEVRSRSFFNLGTGELRAARQGLAEAKQALQSQQLPAAKERLTQCRGELARAEELYGQALMQPAADAVPPEWVSGNLQKLADDTAEVEELLKKIEELERQQQQARDQTRQAKDQNQQEQQDQQDQQDKQDQQNQQNQQGQQNEQKQQDAGEKMRQARASAEQLAEQAKELEQRDLKESAERAAEELRQAETAREAGKPKQAEQHLDAALKELGETPQESPKEDKKSGQSKEDSAKDKDQPSPEGKGEKPPQEAAGTASASPAGEKAPKPDREAARRMLEVMADQEKELREALKEQAARQLPKAEKDW